VHAFCEEDSKAFWREGKVGEAVHAGVLAAAAVTLLVARIAPTALCEHMWLHRSPARWFGDWLVFGLAVAIGLAYLPRFRVARTLRVALVLPIAQLAAIGVAAVMWSSISEARYVGYVTTAIATCSTAVGITVELGLVCAIAGCAIGRRRERAHVALQIALANLLLAGLWLPIASGVLADHVVWTIAGAEVTSPWRVLAIAAVPPLACAIAFGAIATRAPELARRLRVAIGVALGCALVAGMLVRLGRSTNASVLYGNFVPTLLAAVIVSVLALAAVAIGALPRRRRTRDALVGTVALAEGFAAQLTLASWLRGPTPATRAFTLVTARGAVPVPAGIALDVQLPAGSTLLATGESIAVVRAGDEVAIEGFVEPPAGHPFRGSSAPQPGPRGLALTRTGDPPPDLAQVALVAWRPCVAYLAIVLVVALPALAGALVLE
jgi:hypothetical protein